MRKRKGPRLIRWNGGGWYLFYRDSVGRPQRLLCKKVGVDTEEQRESLLAEYVALEARSKTEGGQITEVLTQLRTDADPKLLEGIEKFEIWLHSEGLERTIGATQPDLPTVRRFLVHLGEGGSINHAIFRLLEPPHPPYRTD